MNITGEFFNDVRQWLMGATPQEIELLQIIVEDAKLFRQFEQSEKPKRGRPKGARTRKSSTEQSLSATSDA